MGLALSGRWRDTQSWLTRIGSKNSQGKLLTTVQTLRATMHGEGLGPVPQTDSMAGSLKRDIRACVAEVGEHS